MVLYWYVTLKRHYVKLNKTKTVKIIVTNFKFLKIM